MVSAARYRIRVIFLGVLLCVCLVGSLGLGRYAVDPAEVLKILLSKVTALKPDWQGQAQTVVLQIRLPRVVMGALIGAGLACAGCAYQAIFQNPMASPDVLGASNGACFGAALGLYCGAGYTGTSLLSFFCGMAAVGVVLLISVRIRGNATLGLILSGIMVGSLGSAGVSYIKLAADPNNTLPAITYWLMGSLASIRNQDAAFAVPLILAGILPIYLWRWKIGVLTAGDEEAAAMGVNVARMRAAVVACATLITAACVSVSGMIGWVGLVIPHFARILVGGDFRRSLPASMLVGGSFLLMVDNFSRLLSTSEIPIGILTAMIGVPLFLYLILREGNRL
ncbi:FecCD family ABC transporter permease [Caproicibacter sp.]|uniref:FecCD family ABC transporter permease n=1 Tax=Caproicibacter sp. TaxID=2814884 RepID=UPI003989C61E